MEEVRRSCAWVAAHSSHVFVDSAGIEKVVEGMEGSIPKVEWDFEGIHYFDGGPLTVQYLLVVDAINFCFWPDEELSYDHLASRLMKALKCDNSVLDADRLQKYIVPINPGCVIPGKCTPDVCTGGLCRGRLGWGRDADGRVHLDLRFRCHGKSE